MLAWIRWFCQFVEVQMDVSKVSEDFLVRILELVDMLIMDLMNILALKEWIYVLMLLWN